MKCKQNATDDTYIRKFQNRNCKELKKIKMKLKTIIR